MNIVFDIVRIIVSLAAIFIIVKMWHKKREER